MFSKSTDHGNDMMVMVLQFFFLFLRSKIFQEISTEIDIKTVTVNVRVKKKTTTIFHGRVQNNWQQVTSPDDRPNIF